MKTNKKGFTLIELLVVVAIIGLLSTLAVVALSSARKKADDSKRLSDVKQIQTALELYYTDKNEYPPAAEKINLGQGVYQCLDTSGFKETCGENPYMGLIPKGPLSGEYYTYTSDETTYTITGELKAGSGNFGKGTFTASPSGIVGQPKVEE